MKSTFLGNGTKLYVGFSQPFSYAQGSTAVGKFLEEFIGNNRTVNDALDLVNELTVVYNPNAMMADHRMRCWMWAQTSDGAVYNWDEVAGQQLPGVQKGGSGDIIHNLA